MKRLIIIPFLLFCGTLISQNLSLYKEDISPEGIKKIGGISLFNDHVYLLLQSNLLFNGKELEASEAVAISQKYPVWDIYSYDTITGNIKNQSERWPTNGATPNGFCIVDETSVLYINNKNQIETNNSELKKALKKFQDRNVVCADPTIDISNNKIWFSANLPESKGEMDLWFMEKQGTEWGSPQNAGDKINSALNDISPSVLNDSILVFSSNKAGSNYDLYFFNLKTEEMIHREQLPETDEFYTGLTPDGQLCFLSKKGKETQLYKARWSVKRSTELKPILASPIQKSIEAKLPENNLVEVKTAASVETKNIQMTNYFGLARFDLTPLMKDSLSRLALSMKEDPELSILICGHASPDGPETTNMMLSYYRANEAYNWLISKNVDESRIYRVYGGEYLYSDTLRARNFSIFTMQTPELPQQIALYPINQGEKEEAVVSRFRANSDEMTYQRYQLNKFLPLNNKQLLLIPVNLLYLAKTGQTAVDIARQYNIAPIRLKQMNNFGDAPLEEDKVLFIIY